MGLYSQLRHRVPYTMFFFGFGLCIYGSLYFQIIVMDLNNDRGTEVYTNVHCKKELAVFPSPAGMSLIKLFLGGNNLVFSRPERVWSVTSRLGTGKWLTLFYSVLILSVLYLVTCIENGDRVNE